MGKKLTLLVAVLACMSIVTILGCSAQDKTSNATKAPASEASGGTSIADWGALYPLEYESFYSDYDLVKLDGAVHSHSNLDNKMDLRDVTAGYKGSLPAVANCVYCKSVEINTIYEENGTATVGMPYFDEQGGINSQVESWNCSTCHSDQKNPAGSVGANIVFWNSLSGDFGKSLDAKNAACVQCHNSLEPYRYLENFEELAAYKYGTDPEGWWKAVWENSGKTDYYDDVFIEGTGWGFEGTGWSFTLNPETKILGIGVFHPDGEMYQNSNHQSLGLTCTSCHMTAETNQKGESYARHAASLSPLASETTLEYCLTCHESQGIANGKEMVKWVREKQSSLAGADAELVAKMAQLKTLIADATKQGNVSEDVLDKARMAHTKGELYNKWQRGGTASPGIKVAMYGSSATLQYINKGIQEVDAGIALFG